jgi:hypothetical protein
VPFTLAVLATILIYTWLLEPRGVPVAIPAAVVLVLSVSSALKSHTSGLAPRDLLPASRATVLFTVPAVLIVLSIGAALGTLHDRGSFLREFAVLVAWGAAQQWVLQTVVLREVRQVLGAQRTALHAPKSAIAGAAFLFALVHLPNPFLMLMTFTGALGWCAIFARYPNIIPLGVSHALATLAVLYAFDDAITGRLRIGAAYLRLWN